MKTYICAVALAAALAATSGGPALAHHSFAMFDLTKESKVTGAIKEFEFTNPHTITTLEAPDDTGKVQLWTFEGVSVGTLFREGWRRDTLKPGDKVTIIYAPLRNGAHGGMFLRAQLPGGYTIYNVGILKGSPGYKPENEADQRRTVEALNAQKPKTEAR